MQKLTIQNGEGIQKMKIAALWTKLNQILNTYSVDIQKARNGKTNNPKWGGGQKKSIYVQLFLSKLLKLRVIQKYRQTFYIQLFMLSFLERKELNLNISVCLFKINTIPYKKQFHIVY